MDNASLQARVNELEERIAKLEKIEKRRQIIKWVKLAIKVAIIVATIAFAYRGYKYLKTNYLDPYDDLRNEIGIKIDGVKNYDYSSFINGLLGK